MSHDGEEIASVLLEYARDKIAVIDDDGVFQYVNRAGQSILRYDPDELVGTGAFDYVHPDDAESTRRSFQQVTESDEPTTETVRYRYRRADGSWAEIESRFSNVTDESLGGYVISSRDVTDRVRAERERDDLSTRIEEIAHAVGDVVWMFSADWDELMFMNPAYEEVYGQPVEALEADPQRFLDAVHPEDVPCDEAAMERLSAGEAVDVEYRVNSDRDYDTYVWIQGEPIVEDGEVVRIVGVTRDVTDRRRRERQLVVMDNLLRHTLRNDMSIVQGHAETIARETDDATAGRAEVIRQRGEALLESAEKQRAIIDVLTEPGTPHEVDVVDAVETAIRVARDRHPGVTIEPDLPDHATALALDEITAALTELVENAVRHDSTGEPTVSITVREEGDEVAIGVRDTCPPIPEEEYRVLTGEQEMDGVYHSTGLGLWLVYWVVDLSKGTIEFEHVDGEGNVITVRLPRPADRT